MATCSRISICRDANLCDERMSCFAPPSSIPSTCSLADLQHIVNEIHKQCEMHEGITPMASRWEIIKRLAREGANVPGEVALPGEGKT